MSPTIEGRATRRYHIRFKNGESVMVSASTICTPDKDCSLYILKSVNGVIVAQFDSSEVVGWHITESTPPTSPIQY